MLLGKHNAHLDHVHNGQLSTNRDDDDNFAGKIDQLVWIFAHFLSRLRYYKRERPFMKSTNDDNDNEGVPGEVCCITACTNLYDPTLTKRP